MLKDPVTDTHCIYMNVGIFKAEVTGTARILLDKSMKILINETAE